MKQLLLSFAVLSTFALAANAQDVRKFTYDVGGYWVKLDTKNMRFLMDGCGEEEWDKVLNYKKVGNKESFSTKSGSGGTIRHEFVKKSKNKYAYTITYPGSKPQTENVTVGSDAPSAKEAAKNPVKAASDGVKGLFNKGKGLFKKKDKK